jgi:tRNA(Ile)-lysidine synthase
LSAFKATDPTFELHRFLKLQPRSVGARPILLACSGGPDSVALVVAASHVPDKKFVFHVAHINHKLRGRNSDADARLVEKLAARFRFPFFARVGAVPKKSVGNLEERARDKRYAALASIAESRQCRMVLTAHTRDDQAETVFMNFLRGAGGDGLAGIPPVRHLSKAVQLGRPFIGIGRQELHGWLNRSNVRSRTDQSNGDERFLRNWLRNRIFPRLERRSPGFKQRLAQSAQLFHDENFFWDQFLGHVERRVVRRNAGGQLLDLGGLLSYSAAVQRRFFRRVIGENILTMDAVERLRHWMMSPPTGGRTFQLRRGRTVTRLSKSQGAPSTKLFLIKDENHK